MTQFERSVSRCLSNVVIGVEHVFKAIVPRMRLKSARGN